MGFGPMAMMKIMGAKKKFGDNHPKFTAFVGAMIKNGVEEGTIIEVTVTRPGAAPVTSNMKVSASDLEALSDIKAAVGQADK